VTLPDRRRALTLIGALVATGAAAQTRPQPARSGRIGFLAYGHPTPGGGFVGQVIREGLQERQWVEGRNVVSVYRFADRNVENLERLARELVAERVDVLVALNTTAAHAARKASTSTPIVFAAGDPHGLVENLARPEGNLTGVTNVAHAVTGKQLQLLREIVPSAVRVSVLVNPDNPATPAFRREATAAAGTMGMRLAFVAARDDRGLDRALAEVSRAAADACFVQSEALYFFEAKRIVDHMAAERLPAMYPSSQFPIAGGLVSYGADLGVVYRQLASYIDQILRGAKPGELPVEQPAKFELVINAGAARALGLSLAPAVRARADKVIE
jgi:putative ABC transport system substrate-binding protein